VQHFLQIVTIFEMKKNNFLVKGTYQPHRLALQALQNGSNNALEFLSIKTL
jgi:hypothetical protein